MPPPAALPQLLLQSCLSLHSLQRDLKYTVLVEPIFITYTDSMQSQGSFILRILTISLHTEIYIILQTPSNTSSRSSHPDTDPVNWTSDFYFFKKLAITKHSLPFQSWLVITRRQPWSLCSTEYEHRER